MMSDNHRLKALLAGWVLRPAGLPIRDGGVAWRGGRIVAAGTRSEILRMDPDVLADLPDSILMPGLVNAHAHLELTDSSFRFRRGFRGRFTGWIRRVVQQKKRLTAKRIVAGIRRGERRLLENGVTSVADTCSFTASLRAARMLRTTVLPEFVGLDRQPTLPRAARAFSPHAPYSVSDENLIRIAGWWDRHPGAALSMHIGESPDEADYFLTGGGSFAELYAGLGIRPRSVPARRVLSHLDRLRLLRHGLTAVHVNDVTAEEARLLSNRDMAVAVCPGSMAWFGFSARGARRLRAAGVRILLGTDSLASNTDLNLFAEIRRARRLWNAPARWLIDAATLSPGERFWSGRVGRIAPGAYADFLLVRGVGTVSDPYENLLKGRAERRILARFIGGNRVSV
ncbi:amidohydrolase family protein [bacterium]|nr:amidohydrolase family protein [bacterium]